MTYARVAFNFLWFKRIPARIVLSTALASVMLAGGLALQGQPLYLIALFGLLPWMPVFMFESLWKIKHYHWIAIFGVVTVLQLGHLMEHIAQVGVLSFTQGTVVCPPPVDTASSAQLAIDAGLRSPDSAPIGLSSSVIVAAGPDGAPKMNADGTLVSGPPACGIFGQLDLEIVHLLWELAGWLLFLALLTQYPRNRLLWFSLFWATIHTVEHLFISYTYFMDPVQVYETTRQIWGTLADGNIVTAYPLGLEAVTVNFYEVAGKFGIAAKNGLLGTLLPLLNASLPTRPYLHLYYNSLVIIPGVIAFVLEIRRVYDHYLAQALPQLETQQMVAVTPRLVPQKYRANENILREGDPADSFYIVSQGVVEVIDEQPDGSPRLIANLRPGEYFGEMGLLNGGRRSATVRALTDVEVLRLDCASFEQLLAESEASKTSIERLIAQRKAIING